MRTEYKVGRSCQTTVTWLMMSQQTLSQLSNQTAVVSCVILKREAVSVREKTVASHSCDLHQPERTGYMAAETFRSVSAESVVSRSLLLLFFNRPVSCSYARAAWSVWCRMQMMKGHCISGLNGETFKWKIYSMSLSSLKVQLWSWISEVEAKGNVKACLVLYHCKP